MISSILISIFHIQVTRHLPLAKPQAIQVVRQHSRQETTFAEVLNGLSSPYKADQCLLEELPGIPLTFLRKHVYDSQHLIIMNRFLEKWDTSSLMTDNQLKLVLMNRDIAGER